MSGRQTTRAVDACQPIVVWAPDPDCEHGVDPDCDHGVWLDTRVTSDALARGALVLGLRAVEDDDGEAVGEIVVDATVSITCSLETGACTPDGTDGAIFLRHHPWLADAIRAELGLLRRRAERAAAQLDRETAAKRALARADTRTMVRHHDLFPADWDLLPIHEEERYWAIDLYCQNPSCTCSSSVILFHQLNDGEEPNVVGEVVIDYAGEREPRAEPSSPLAAEIFQTLWARSEYKLRGRHAEAAQAVKRFAQPRTVANVASRAAGRQPRNAPCPCGSGKKYKRCCLDAQHATPLPADDAAPRS